MITVTHIRKNHIIRTLAQDEVLSPEGKILKRVVLASEDVFISINQAKRASRLLQKKVTLNDRPILMRAYTGK